MHRRTRSSTNTRRSPVLTTQWNFQVAAAIPPHLRRLARIRDALTRHRFAAAVVISCSGLCSTLTTATNQLPGCICLLVARPASKFSTVRRRAAAVACG